MKKLLNTLFVTTEGSYLTREGETVVVRYNEQVSAQYPIHILAGIVCIRHIMCSPPLMKLCADNNVSLSFLNLYGRFIAKLQGPVNGNVLLRRQQYRYADNESISAEIAKTIVMGKVANSRLVLMRAARETDNAHLSQTLHQISDQLARSIGQVNQVASVDTWRGIEGETAKTYFSAFDHLILAHKEDFFFLKRSRRPPTDNLNALLSFVYTLLAQDVVSAIESVGLDPAVGFLHRDRPGRPSFALDLMEEFRPAIADRLVLTLINRLQVKGKGFQTSESGCVTMDDETRKTVLTAYQVRKKDEVMHPILNEKIPIGLLPFAQALLFARFIRGDIPAYPPMVWR